MTEETQDSQGGQQGQQGAEGAGEKTTMASIASEIQSDEEPGKETQKQEQVQQPPDNLDEMKQYFNKNVGEMDKIRNQVTEAADTISAIAQREQQRLLDQAVDEAVKVINDNANGNANLAETFLNSMYQRDADFKRVFDNREQNPGAYKKALDLLGEEWKVMNEKKIDSNVAENQRALQESQSPGGSVERQNQQDSETERLAKMGDGDFLREAHRMANSA